MAKASPIPATEQVKTSSKHLETSMMPAAQALAVMATYFDPFLRKLMRNTGDAQISCTVQYIEQHRPEPTPEPVSPKPLPATQVFRAGPDRIRSPRDLPCPLCKSAAGLPCEPSKSGRTMGSTGIHSERLSMWIRYAELSVAAPIGPLMVPKTTVQHLVTDTVSNREYAYGEGRE